MAGIVLEDNCHLLLRIPVSVLSQTTDTLSGREGSDMVYTNDLDLRLLRSFVAVTDNREASFSATSSLVHCLVNLFRKWQDLWRPPMLCVFC